jgi:purine-binding chemotaxis protein CheW
LVPLVVFTLDGHRYALATEHVHEVVRAVTVARLPKAPAIVEGVINVRGTLIPVLNLRSRFALPDRPLHPAQHLIVAQAGRRVVALRVDRAVDLIAVEASAIEAAEPIAPGAEYVAGIARLSDGLIVIHDLERFLALDEARRLDAALAEREGAS